MIGRRGMRVTRRGLSNTHIDGDDSQTLHTGVLNCEMTQALQGIHQTRGEVGQIVAILRQNG